MSRPLPIRVRKQGYLTAGQGLVKRVEREHDSMMASKFMLNSSYPSFRSARKIRINTLSCQFGGRKERGLCCPNSTAS